MMENKGTDELCGRVELICTFIVHISKTQIGDSYQTRSIRDFARCICHFVGVIPQYRERTGLVVRASDSGSGDPGSILGRVGVLFP